MYFPRNIRYINRRKNSLKSPLQLLYFVPRPEGVKDDQSIPILFDWRPQGNYLASSNGTISVRISDRYGEIFDDFNAPEKDKFLQWHKDGDYLAAVGSNSPQVTMYTVSIKEANEIDLGLATKKTPVMGKHQRAITSGAFNDKGLLALGSEDATITISNAQGDTVNSFGCNAEPEDVHYVKIFDEFDKNLDEYFITAVLSKRTLMVASALGSDPPVNLQFQDKYGNIKKCCWYEKGHVLMAFENGTIVCLRLDRTPDKSQEMFSVKDFESYLSDLSLCLEARMAICIGDNCIKVRHLDRLSELTSLVTVEDDQKGLDKVKANNNGSLLAVTGKSGTMMIFLTKIPIIGSAYRDKIVYLSSLNKVKIHFDGDRDPIEIDVRVEPSHLSVSDYHIAVVTNNRAWFYELHTKSALSAKHTDKAQVRAPVSAVA
uniref:Uncharacterized protein n=1 Tax=Panagrolaimus superbus TaxID=310955 RepID=A0A914YDJ8_9BILA